MINLTPEQLAELAALEKAATPGEWDTWGECAEVSRGYEETGDYRHVADFVSETDEDGMSVQSQQDMDNAVFIAALRNAAPELIAARQFVQRLADEGCCISGIPEKRCCLPDKDPCWSCQARDFLAGKGEKES